MNNKKGENFFKSFGLGLVYTLVFPLIVVGAFLYGVYGLSQWLVVTAKGLIRFFKGDRFFPPLREDKEVALLIKRQHEAILQGTPATSPTQPAIEPAPTSNNVYVQNNYYSQQEKKLENDPPRSPNGNPSFIEGNTPYDAAPSFSPRPQNEPQIIYNEPQQAIPSFSKQNEPHLMEIPSFSPNDNFHEETDSNVTNGGNNDDIR